MYQQPTVVDYGNLLELTEAQGLNGSEDGASKMVPTHHVPAPSGPTGT